MVYKKFALGVVIRLIILISALSAAVVIWISTPWLFTQIVLLILLIALVIELFQYVTKTNRDLAKFIDAINYHDYSVNFSGYKIGNAFDELHQSFKRTLQSFKELKLEKEAHYQYLHQLIKAMGAGVMAIDPKGKIILYNDAAVELLGLPNLIQWDRYQNPVPNFYTAGNRQKSTSSELIKLKNSEVELNLRVNRIRVKQEEHRILVFQDIKQEIDEKELAAWNTLIRILTHEIMNSVTPIVSLSDSLVKMEGARADQNEDILLGLQTIEKRSKSLLKFVEDYKKLVNIPAPVKREVPLATYLQEQVNLYQTVLATHKIDLRLAPINPAIKIMVDEMLLNQLMSNLFSNSMSALANSDKKQIDLTIRTEPYEIIIDFKDSGPGIPSSHLQQIFVPFYSTKSSGSGIGLSLSKQIMHMHSGQLKVKTKQGAFTQFSLHFPAY